MIPRCDLSLSEHRRKHITSLDPGYEDAQRSIKSSLGTHWRLLLFEGVILIILGVLAIAAPAIATLAVDLYIGWLFLFAGFVGVFAVFKMRDIPSFLLSLIPAVFSIVIGALLIWKPAEGALSLTALMVVFFAAEGQPRLPIATTLRAHGAGSF